MEYLQPLKKRTEASTFASATAVAKESQAWAGEFGAEAIPEMAHTTLSHVFRARNNHFQRVCSTRLCTTAQSQLLRWEKGQEENKALNAMECGSIGSQQDSDLDFQGV